MTAAAMEEEPTAADLAERALLGALLWDPQRAHEVAGWLRGEDFQRPAHAAIYQTITGLQADGEPVDLRTLPRVLASGRYHDLHVARDGTGPLGAAALHSLLSMTPATPRAVDGPFDHVPERSEHVRYARIVLDGSIRRRLGELGSRVGQYAAHLAGVPSDDAGEHLQVALADVDAQLDALTGRREHAERATSPIAAALDPQPRPARPAGPAARRAGADTGGAELPSIAPEHQPLTSAQVRQAEHRFIAAAISCPPVRALLEERALPTDFLDPQVGATWHAIQTLRRRGEPVDLVLVADAVERQGEHPTLGPGLRPAQLLDLHTRHPDVVDGYRAAEAVLRAALTRTAAQAAGRLHELGTGPQPNSANALSTARTAIYDAAAAVRRLTGTAPSAAAAALTPPPQRQHPLGGTTTRPTSTRGALPAAPSHGRRP